MGSISYSTEDRGWFLFYLLQCGGQRLVWVLYLAVQRQRLVLDLSFAVRRTEAGVGSISNSAEDRG